MGSVMNRLEVDLGKIRLQSPLMTASGTSGHGNEVDRLKKARLMKKALGAFVTKGVTLMPRKGNTGCRIVETHGGVLNAIGLQNKGAEVFVKEQLPRLLNFELPLIVNISADRVEEFGELAGFLCEHDINGLIEGIEINVSCPNIKQGGSAFGTDPKLVETIVGEVKKRVDPRLLIITKLTPNITDITEAGRAAVEGGTDALSMINTLKGMAVDIHQKKPMLGNITGGLSGPAVKPVGLYMVYECFRNIVECRSKQVPIIGVGGISGWTDVVEYILAGASAVGIGTAWFADSDIFSDIHQKLSTYLNADDLTISGLIGAAHDRLPCS